MAHFQLQCSVLSYEIVEDFLRTKLFEQFHEILKHLFLGITENDRSISYLDETKILHVDIIENIK